MILILVSSKVASFHNEAHTFLYQKRTFSIRTLYKSTIIDNISFLTSIFSRPKGQSLCCLRVYLGYSKSTSKTKPFELFLVYLFKSKSSGLANLNPLNGRNLDIA